MNNPTSSIASVATSKYGSLRGRLAQAAWLASLFTATVAVVYLSQEFSREAGRVASIWPLNAILLVILLRQSPRSDIAVLSTACAANIATNFAMGDSLISGSVLAIANIVEVTICVQALRRPGARFDITRSNDLLRFVVVAGGVAPALSALMAAITLSGSAAFQETLVTWFAADALGMMILAPALLSIGSGQSSSRDRRSVVEWVFGAAILLSILVLVFGQTSYPLLFVVPPILILATFRTGVSGAAISVIATAIVAIIFALAGRGPTQLIAGSDTERILVLQGFLALMTLTTLPVASALAAARRTKENLQDALDAALREQRADLEDDERRAEATDNALDMVAESSGEPRDLAARIVVRVIAVATAVISGAFLAGWIWNVLTASASGAAIASVKPQTMLGFVCAALVLGLAPDAGRGGWRGYVRIGLLCVVGLVGAIPLLESAIGFDFQLDQFFLGSRAATGPQITPVVNLTALAFLMFFAASLLAGRVSRPRDIGFVVFAAVGLVAALLAMVGNLYETGLLFERTSDNAPPLPSAIGLVMLSLGLMATRPDIGWVAMLRQGSVTATFAAWLLPAIVVGPVALGWLIVAGERAGAYGNGQELAIFATVTVAALAMLMLRLGILSNRIGRSLESRDRLNARLVVAREEADRARAAASASETLFRTISDTSTDMIVRMRVDGKITFVSQSSFALLGYRSEELIGLPKTALVHGDDAAAVEAFFASLRTEGREAAPRVFQYRARRKNGDYVWLEGSPRVLFNAAGERYEIQDSVRDITVRKQLEEALIEARTSAESATRAKAEFLANMSHELRTPLNSVIGFTQLLERSRSIPSTERRYVELVSASSQGLLAIVNDILDFSSLESGGIRLDERPFSIATSSHRCIDSLRPQADAKDISLELEIDERLETSLVGDPSRLHQILTNLMGNAVKFTEQGRVRLSVRASSPSDGRQRVRFEVEDTGIGIPADRVERLFGRFSQGDSSIARRFGGSGLGLAITRSLVDLMKGKIGVESIEGRGSTFWFELELEIATGIAPAANADAHAVVTASSGGERRILVVDDVDVNRELASAFLARHPYRVDHAADGAEAVALVQSNRYDLIFMDVQMPGMDGLAATRAIRSLPGYGRVPIVAMTAQALPDQIAACRAAGMDDYVAKPLSIDSLPKAIRKWTGESRRGPVAANPSSAMAALRTRFVERTRVDLEQMTALLSDDAAPPATLYALIHRFAGTAGTLGFADVGDAALALDREISEGRSPSRAELASFLKLVEQMLDAA